MKDGPSGCKLTLLIHHYFQQFNLNRNEEGMGKFSGPTTCYATMGAQVPKNSREVETEPAFAPQRTELFTGFYVFSSSRQVQTTFHLLRSASRISQLASKLLFNGKFEFLLYKPFLKKKPIKISK